MGGDNGKNGVLREGQLKMVMIIQDDKQNTHQSNKRCKSRTKNVLVSEPIPNRVENVKSSR